MYPLFWATISFLDPCFQAKTRSQHSISTLTSSTIWQLPATTAVCFWHNRSASNRLITRADHSHWIWCVQFNQFHDLSIFFSRQQRRSSTWFQPQQAVPFGNCRWRRLPSLLGHSLGKQAIDHASGSLTLDLVRPVQPVSWPVNPDHQLRLSCHHGVHGQHFIRTSRSVFDWAERLVA